MVWSCVHFCISAGEEVCFHQGGPEPFRWHWANKGTRGQQPRLVPWRTLGRKQDKAESRQPCWNSPKWDWKRTVWWWGSTPALPQHWCVIFTSGSSTLRPGANLAPFLDTNAALRLIPAVTLSWFKFIPNFYGQIWWDNNNPGTREQFNNLFSFPTFPAPAWVRPSW